MTFDHDPEDAYDAGDLPGERLRVIGRIVDDLRHSVDVRREPRRYDALRLLDNISHEPGVDLLQVADLRRALGAI